MKRESDGPAILYVDRDDAASDLVAEELRDAYVVVRARTDEEASDLLRVHQHRFRAIVIDSELPGSEMTGLEFAAFLKGASEDFEAPIVVLGRPTQPLDPVAYRHVSDAMLMKPLELAGLTLAIANWTLR